MGQIRFSCYNLEYEKREGNSMLIGIIGGGPAGIMAALQIKNHKLIMFERNDRIGKKLLATGNGRCNYTNVDIKAKHYHGEQEGFVEPALEYFDNEALIEYFKKEAALSSLELERGKIYPRTLKASTLLNIFLRLLEKKGVEIKTDHYLKQIKRKGKGFLLFFKDREPYYVDRVVFACGGMSMPQSGSDGNGYKILKDFGHRVTDCFPGLVQIKLDCPYLKHISGTKVQGRVRLLANENLLAEKEGDLLFTDYGISGPPILDISRKVGERILKEKLKIEMPLINNLDDKTLELLRNSLDSNRFNLDEILEAFIDKKFIKLVKETLKKMHFSSKQFNDKIIETLCKYTFDVVGLNSFGQSQITCGGIATEDIDKSNMQSKLVKGLYVIGEVLDVDGDCGGYNIQWAFSSAALAAKSLSEEDI
ncbi:flavoprotein family protein [Clostridiales bacterium KA00134]|nr:flavoprotein family protein [Clostridiales bacterium KA00134]